VSLVNSSNAKGAAALYTYDAVMFAPGHPTAWGTAPITAILEKEIAGMKSAGLILGLGTENEVGVTGDMAWHSGTYVIKDKAGKTADTGKYLEVWKKAGGKWRIIRDAWNSDGPPAPAAPPAPSAPAAAPKK
jgi:ketosteroid isomerase-like protein